MTAWADYRGAPGSREEQARRRRNDSDAARWCPARWRRPGPPAPVPVPGGEGHRAPRPRAGEPAPPLARRSPPPGRGAGGPLRELVSAVLATVNLVVSPVSSLGDHAARAWGRVLSWRSIRRSRSPRSVRVNFQLNGLAIAL